MAIRDSLHRKFKRRCRLCRRTHLEVKLHLDCIVPQGDEHHRKMGWRCRMRFYQQQDKANNLGLLCESCNGRKGSVGDKRYHRLMRQRMEEAMDVEQQAETGSVCDLDKIPF